MAWSYRHITNSKNEFIWIELIDNLGDAYEALEECYGLINILSWWDKQKIAQAHFELAKKEGWDLDFCIPETYWDKDDEEDNGL